MGQFSSCRWHASSRNIAKRHRSDQRSQAEKLFPFIALNLSSFYAQASKIDLKHEVPA